MLYTFDSHSKFLSSLQELSDEGLLRAICGGSEDALSELYKRHHLTLRAVIGRVLHNEQSVEDLLQEVFLEIWRLAERYSADKGKALGWMITLARRRAIDRLRREQAYSRVEERFQQATEQQPDAWTRVHGEEDIEAADLRRLLQSVINTLPEAQRSAIELAFYKGLSQREIATQTQTPLGTIKTRIELAIRKIAAKLRDLAGESVTFPSAV